MSGSSAEKKLLPFKQPACLLSEEIKRTRMRGFARAVLCVFLLFLVFVFSHFTYNRSAQKYFEKQAYDTMTEVSMQISRVVTVRVEYWYEELDAANNLVSQYIAEHPAEDRFGYLLSELNHMGLVSFDEKGIVTKGGLLYLTDGRRYNLKNEPFINELLADTTKGKLAGRLDTRSYAIFNDKLLLATPVEGRDTSDGDTIAAVVVTLDADYVSRLLYTDIFGDNMAYVVISDERGNVIVDTQSEKHFDSNLLDTFSRFASQRDLDTLRRGLERGEQGTMELMGETTRFLTYYSPVIDEGDGGELASNSEYSVADWRLLILTRTDVLTENISELFDESCLLLYAVLCVFGAVMLAWILLDTRRHNRETVLRCTDGMTGLLHDERFEKDANVLLGRGGAYAVVSYNIVRFKLLNERIGHDEADAVLGEVGRTILAFMRPDETAAHSFADRFTVFMRMDTPEKTERIRVLEKRLLAAEYPEQVHPRFTIGVYELTGDDKDVFAPIDRARLAQTVAHERRSVLENVVVYTPEMSARRAEEGTLADMAEGALRDGNFIVYYQLKKDLRGGWAGSEALVRWRDPKLGFIYPSKFIPLFERSGFVVKLDRYVFEHVCSDLREAIDSGEKTVPVSVNLSECHFEEENFFDEYEEIMAKYNVPHELIEFEVTESLVADNPDKIKALIDHLHAIGCKCSLDDFGTGYSSLSMVQDFGFDTIKLDRSFFYGRNGFNSDSQLIVETLIELSHKLHKSVISEGIENAEQVDFLKDKDCDMIQGYYYARPVPADEYRRRLNEE